MAVIILYSGDSELQGQIEDAFVTMDEIKVYIKIILKGNSNVDLSDKWIRVKEELLKVCSSTLLLFFLTELLEKR